MPYFDSQKNRALWDKELAELRKEKEARKQGRAAESKEPAAKANNAFEKNNEAFMGNNMPYREKTSYKELLREEQESVNSRKMERVTQKQKTKAMEMDTPSFSNKGV